MYYDTLESIERNYGCVAEYNRCMAEREMYEVDMYDPCAHNMDDMEIPYEIDQDEPNVFCEGMQITDYEFDGGVTHYTVEKIDRTKKKVLLSEVWENIDGSGKRPSKWHKLDTDKKGNERAFLWSSETYGESWIYATSYKG